LREFKTNPHSQLTGLAEYGASKTPASGSATLSKTEKKRQLAGGRGGEGVGVELNHTTARKRGLVPERLERGGPLLLTIETEANRDSTNERGPSLVGSLGS
jgi:hypothetical protein